MGATKGGPRDRLYRKAAQFIGTEVFRNPDFLPGITGPNYWCDLMSERLQTLAAGEDARLSIQNSGPLFRETLVLVDDVRFMNEVEVLRRWGAKLIFIDGYRRLMPTINEPWRNHVSEALATDYTFGRHDDELFDVPITNNDTEASFRRTINRMASHWSGLRAEGRLDD
jgi:hypothetical protein